MYSQQLIVEDSNDTRTLQTVGGSATLAFLEDCWQLLDLIPLTSVLQRKHTHAHTEIVARTIQPTYAVHNTHS